MVKEDTLQIFMRKVFDIHCTLLWWHIFVITDNYVDMSDLYVVLSDLYLTGQIIMLTGQLLI